MASIARSLVVAATVFVGLAAEACGGGEKAAPASSDGSDVTVGGAASAESGAPGAAGDPVQQPTGGNGAEGGDLPNVVTAGGETSTNPIDQACTGDRAFAVSGSAFVEPTEQALALALNQDTYGTSPITFVLRSGGKSQAAASYTVDAGGKQAFAAELAPPMTIAWLRDGGFGTESAQATGYLLVNTASGSLEVPLQNLTFSITTQANCTRGTARLSATIPKERRDLVEKLTGASPAEGGAPGRAVEIETPIQALLDVQLVDFDFGSMP